MTKKGHKIEETTENRNAEEKVSSRRDMFSLSMAGIAAGLVSACGKQVGFKGGGSVKDKKGSLQKTGDATGMNGDDKIATDVVNGESAPDAAEIITDTSEAGTVVTIGTRDISSATPADPDALRERHYGSRSETLLALAHVKGGFEVGDELQLLKPIDEKTGLVLVTKTIVPTQEGSIAQVFDNLYLEGCEEIWLLQTRGNSLTKYKINKLSEKLNKEPSIGNDKKICHLQGMIASGNFKSGYYDVMPSLKADPKEGSEIGNYTDGISRKYFFAGKGTQWSTVQFETKPQGLNTDNSSVTEIILYDPVGRELQKTSGKSLSLTSEHMLNHNMLVVYVNDGSEYNRYFYFLG